jgi:peptide-methionine (S)-S-oxide reductase
VGYTGSQDHNNIANLKNPNYKNMLDYTEAIQITFDPSKLSYEYLVSMFFYFHTPDDSEIVGRQYRSVIFYHTEDQQRIANEIVQSWGSFGKYVAVEKSKPFYRAEEYHQKYMDKF